MTHELAYAGTWRRSADEARAMLFLGPGEGYGRLVYLRPDGSERRVERVERPAWGSVRAAAEERLRSEGYVPVATAERDSGGHGETITIKEAGNGE